MHRIACVLDIGWSEELVESAQHECQCRLCSQDYHWVISSLVQ